MSAYRTTLLVIHVLGAIAGIGPSFAFGILGRMAGEAGPAGVWLLKASEKIEKAMVRPVAYGTQWISGVLLIFDVGYDDGFFRREWLVSGIGLYIAIIVISASIASPAMSKMIELAESGKGQTPEMGALVKKVSTAGPIMTVLTVAIIVLMVWKPGN